jgi:cardiolipin synthase A/B
MGDGSMPDRWRETDVRVEGPVVEHLQGAFAENWLEATGVVLGGEDVFPRPQPVKGRAFAQVVRSSPSGGSYGLYTTLLLAISSARRTIYLTNPYFLPDATILDALVQATNRKVKVVILLPGRIDHQIVRQAGKRHFGPLLEAGIEIFEFQPALLHAKTLVIDGVWSTIGSSNLDNRSFALNDELNLVVYDREVASRLERVFADDLARSRRVTYEAWQRRPIKDRLIELLVLPIRDLL